MQGQRQHFVRRVDQGNPAVGESRRQFRLEQQVEAVQRSVGQAPFDLLAVEGQADGAPGVGHRGVARTRVAGLQFAQARLDLVEMLQAPGVELLQGAGAHQPLGHGIAGKDKVVAAVPRHQLGLEGLAAVHHVIDHADAGFPGERGEGIGREVVGPVIQAQHFLFRLGHAQAQEQRGEQRSRGTFHGDTSQACRLAGSRPSRLISGPYSSGRRSR